MALPRSENAIRKDKRLAIDASTDGGVDLRCGAQILGPSGFWVLEISDTGLERARGWGLAMGVGTQAILGGIAPSRRSQRRANRTDMGPTGLRGAAIKGANRSAGEKQNKHP